MLTPEEGGTGSLRNSRQPATHNLRRPNGSYTAEPGEDLDCLLDFTCPMGGWDFAPPNSAPTKNPQPGLSEVIKPDTLSLEVGQLNLNRSLILPALEYGCIVWVGSLQSTHSSTTCKNPTTGLLLGDFCLSRNSHECHGGSPVIPSSPFVPEGPGLVSKTSSLEDWKVG